MHRTYSFDRSAAGPAEAPRLDPSQQAAVDHPGGPLLVLAGPGTGKTTTLVEAVIDRINNRGVRPEEVLVLTFSRKAAEELRTRIGRRLGRTTTAVPAMTFHSFCYGLVREFQDKEAYASPLTLLSAGEQDWRIQEVVTNTGELGSIDWPEALQPALRTRGLARELQSFMARARSLGMEPKQVSDLAVAHDRPDWAIAAKVFEGYLTNLDYLGQVDYSEVVYRAVLIALHEEFGPKLRERYKLVVVDEYQDTDPLQVRLLKALAGGGRDLIAVGDPDQSIYAFRGADIRGIYDFGDDFATTAGPAPSLALTATRRFGPVILGASRSILDATGRMGRIDKVVFDQFRNPTSVDPEYGDGDVSVRTYVTAAAEAEHIALLLREAHLRDELPWREMAVLVRSGTASLPRLQRALVAAGVPVEIASDETPLSAEPAVRALIAALRAVEELQGGRDIIPEAATELLTGQLCGLDASAMRRLARALRLDHRLDGEFQASTALLAEALGEPAMFQIDASRHGDQAAEAGRRAHVLALLLSKAGKQAQARVAPEQILWTLWDGTRWPVRLRETAERGGDGSLQAHRDLDAACALFDLAARAEERKERIGITAFVEDLESQEIPGSTLADRGVRGDAVRLMTAHRSKGLQWRLVVVAGVQDGLWPDVRYRGSLLQVDRLERDHVGSRPQVPRLLAEERRLFYVAATRAQERLIVTAVESPREDGEQPSRFFTDLRTATGGRTLNSVGRPVHALSLRSAVARLRLLAETGKSDLVRARAAVQLGQLAGHPAGAAAHPDRWWGLREVTTSEVPIRPTDKPLALSGSAMDGLMTCPLKWFMSREAKGEAGSTSAQGFGLLVHRLAAEVVHASWVDAADLESHLDRVWSQLDYAAPWIAQRDRLAAHEAISRFARWHNRSDGRTALAAEHEFSVEVPVGEDVVVLRGSMDRVEVDADGRIYVIDFKTSKSAVSGLKLKEHPQLGVYQLVVGNGGVRELTSEPAPQCGGAELVQLRVPDSAGSPEFPKVQPQAPPDPDAPFFAYGQLAKAVEIVRTEQFDATRGDACTFCSFRSLCPAQPEGQSILSDGAR